MKRSLINREIEWAKNLVAKHNINLPVFAHFKKTEWQKCLAGTQSITKTMLGWDITDYHMDKYDELGGVLFTVRNGDQQDSSIGTPYAEKLILLHDGQSLPLHFHYSKTEDIINRSGGILALQLYNAHDDNTVDYDSDVIVYMDGIQHTVKAGEVVEVTNGNSISLTPRMYHLFWAKKGAGDLVVGEVSSVNDDNVDNHFALEMGRFSEIDEDEAIIHPLCNEYKKFDK
ncbi:MAG: D-lyxose/D-mannose family sugar isomerase [Clostridiales bacterium]|nr:D-lyxose/D-mannose family sugar isomerase [Clostridiales bacterium]